MSDSEQEPHEDNSVDDISSLLDELHRATEVGDAAGFWKRHLVSSETRVRLESALQNILLVQELYNDRTISEEPAVELDWLRQLTMTLDRFQISNEIGRGGFGVVYLAEDLRLKRKVAIKIPRIEAMCQSAWRERFFREAEVMAQLEHLHIVPIYEVGESDNTIFVVSQYCPGPNLMQWLIDHPNRLTTYQIAELILCLADGLAYCHRKGVIHRDLKPANILLFPETHGVLPFLPRINDFGLARTVGSESDNASGRMLVGTPQYMSPEAAQSDLGGLGPASDMFSLGVIMYELLVGTAPFAACSLTKVLAQVRDWEPPSMQLLNLPIPVDLKAICLKCLQKNPRERYESADVVAAELRLFLSSDPNRSKQDGRPSNSQSPFSTSHRIWSWILAVACFGVVVFAVVATLPQFWSPPSALDAGSGNARVDEGLEFNATTNRVFVADNSYDGTTPVTLEAWISPDYPGGTFVNLNGIIAIQADDGKSDDGAQIIVQLPEDRMVYYNTTRPLSRNVWHHLAAVYNGSHVKFFIDGVEAPHDIYIDDGDNIEQQSESPALKLRVVWPDIGLVIGANSSNGSSRTAYPFHGRIASVMVSHTVRYATTFVPHFKLEPDAKTEALYLLKSDIDPILDHVSKSRPAFRRALQ